MSKEDPSPEDQWLRPGQARRRAGVSRSTFDKYVAAGVFKRNEIKVLPSGQHRYLASAVDRILQPLPASNK
jgi:predicted site-specific integrase-resolvase